MLRSWKLGTAFGIGVYVHWTFLLLPAWVFLRNLGLGGVGLAFYLAALTFVIFGCVVLHEFGHALMARHYGIRTRDITLYPIGGVARLERMSERPWEEFWIALAGPAVNVVIAAGLFLAMALTQCPMVPSGFGDFGGFEHFLPDLLYSNLFLVIFNLMPAFPMDGGRVLRAVLAAFIGRLRATEVAAQLGAVMAVLFFFAGFYIPSLLLISIFLFFAGQQELAAVRYQEGRRRQEPLEVLPVEEDVGWTTPPLRPGFSGFIWDAGLGRWVEWRNGRPTNTVSA